MNSEQALEQFVKVNRDLLLSDKFSRDQLKITKRQYFVTQNHNKYPIPNTKELQIALVRWLLKNGLSQKIPHYLEDLPFFKEGSQQTRDELYAMLDAVEFKSALTEEEVNTLRSHGSYETLKKIKSKEVVAELEAKLQDYDRRIDEKKNEYESIPSVLDQENFPEPDFDPIVENVKTWWERFYLQADPFSRKDGLSSVPESLYEQVLVKTKPFQDTLSALQRDSTYLFHTGFLLVGDFGFGKTTFIDYLSYHLTNLNILPIRISSGKEFPDSTGFSNHFYLKLRDELKREFKTISVEPPDFLTDLEIDSQIMELLDRITKNRRAGVVVFLDDYHKHRTTHIYKGTSKNLLHLY